MLLARRNKWLTRLYISAFALIGLAVGACSETSQQAEAPSVDLGKIPPDLSLVRRLEAPGGFGNITDVAVSNDGVIAVADGMNRNVLLFSRQGREEPRTVGGPGSGPGEFRYPLAVGFKSDTLLVFDQSSSRLSRFKAETAEFISSSQVKRQPRYGQKPEVDISESGQLYALGFFVFQEALMKNLGARTRGVTRGANHILRWDSSANEWERLQLVQGIEVFADVGRGMLVDVAYPKKPVWAPKADGVGVWFADSADSVIWGRGRIGSSPVDSVETGLAAFPVPTEIRREYLHAADLAGQEEDEIRRAREIRAEIPFPDSMPPLLRILPTEGGGVWVLARTPTGRALRFVNAHGDKSRVYRAPPRFDPLVVNGRLLTGIQRDAMGVQTVATYELMAQP